MGNPTSRVEQASEGRLDRELETRETTTRRKSWSKPELLPTPKAQDGWDFYWVRVATQGKDDPTNVSSKLREGWEPCKAADHPEVHLVSIENDRYADNIVMGGLMLCKAPTEMMQERTAYYEKQTHNQMASVDNNLMRENDPRMPLFQESKSTVKFGDKS